MRRVAIRLKSPDGASYWKGLSLGLSLSFQRSADGWNGGVVMERNSHVFPDQWREGVYQAIIGRRDIRGQFTSASVPDEVLDRILNAAHHAPSVGYSQPWDFIVIRDGSIRKKVKAAFLSANDQAVEKFDTDKRETYRSFKLEGILESAVNICVTCDRERFGPIVIGRTSQPEMDLFSSVCAVQNLWLAARAEGVGVGWVSIIDPTLLAEILGLPANVVPVAYLCVGYVTGFPDEPELKTAGWLPRVPLSQVTHQDQWGRR